MIDMKKILIIHGPNLNMLSVRDVHLYGEQTLEDINGALLQRAQQLDVLVDCFQSNTEGDIIDQIHRVKDEYDGLIINAGAYTHYSYAIADAIDCVRKPCVEVHMTNIYARDAFRQKSVLAGVCVGTICGFGKNSYLLALDALMNLL